MRVQIRCVTLILLTLFCCSSHLCNAQFTGLIKPLDCADYTGTVADYSTSYSTLYRDTENGTTSTYYEGIGSHPGVDIHRLRDGTGSSGAAIKAIYDGVISKKYVSDGTKKGWGNCLVIKHENNIPGVGIVYSCYAHMVKFEGNPSENQSVHKGDVLGYVGTTGNSTGPHLHFQIDKDYTDYGNGLHPYFPQDVNAPDKNGEVLKHTYNPMVFLKDHSNPTDLKDIYVDAANGNDGNSGDSSSPFKTVSKALESSTVERIFLRAGTYNEQGKGRPIKIRKKVRIIKWDGSGNARIAPTG